MAVHAKEPNVWFLEFHDRPSKVDSDPLDQDKIEFVVTAKLRLGNDRELRAERHRKLFQPLVYVRL